MLFRLGLRRCLEGNGNRDSALGHGKLAVGYSDRLAVSVNDGDLIQDKAFIWFCDNGDGITGLSLGRRGSSAVLGVCHGDGVVFRFVAFDLCKSSSYSHIRCRHGEGTVIVDGYLCTSNGYAFQHIALFRDGRNGNGCACLGLGRCSSNGTMLRIVHGNLVHGRSFSSNGLEGNVDSDIKIGHEELAVLGADIELAGVRLVDIYVFQLIAISGSGADRDLLTFHCAENTIFKLNQVAGCGNAGFLGYALDYLHGDLTGLRHLADYVHDYIIIGHGKGLCQQRNLFSNAIIVVFDEPDRFDSKLTTRKFFRRGGNGNGLACFCLCCRHSYGNLLLIITQMDSMGSFIAVGILGTLEGGDHHDIACGHGELALVSVYVDVKIGVGVPFPDLEGVQLVAGIGIGGKGNGGALRSPVRICGNGAILGISYVHKVQGGIDFAAVAANLEGGSHGDIGLGHGELAVGDGDSIVAAVLDSEGIQLVAISGRGGNGDEGARLGLSMGCGNGAVVSRIYGHVVHLAAVVDGFECRTDGDIAGRHIKFLSLRDIRCVVSVSHDDLVQLVTGVGCSCDGNIVTLFRLGITGNQSTVAVGLHSNIVQSRLGRIIAALAVTAAGNIVILACTEADDNIGPVFRHGEGILSLADTRHLQLCACSLVHCIQIGNLIAFVGDNGNCYRGAGDSGFRCRNGTGAVSVGIDSLGCCHRTCVGISLIVDSDLHHAARLDVIGHDKAGDTVTEIIDLVMTVCPVIVDLNILENISGIGIGSDRHGLTGSCRILIGNGGTAAGRQHHDAVDTAVFTAVSAVIVAITNGTEFHGNRDRAVWHGKLRAVIFVGVDPELAVRTNTDDFFQFGELAVGASDVNIVTGFCRLGGRCRAIAFHDDGDRVSIRGQSLHGEQTEHHAQDQKNAHDFLHF